MRSRSMLLVIDLQIGLALPDYGARSSAPVVANVEALLRCWRQFALPIAFTQRLSSRPGSPLERGQSTRAIELRVAPAQQELVFDKTTNSASKVAGLASFVASKDPAEPVITGLATDACITATAREAKDLGYNVVILSDACATFARVGGDGSIITCEVVHDVALAALRASGIAVRTTREQIDLVEALP